MSKMKLVTLLIPQEYSEGLDELVCDRIFSSRSKAIRDGIRTLLSETVWKAGHTQSKAWLKQIALDGQISTSQTQENKKNVP